MKGQRLKGKIIKKVHTKYYPSDSGRSGCWGIAAIEFTDGSFARFVTIELDCDYGTEIVYPAKAITATEIAERRL